MNNNPFLNGDFTTPYQVPPFQTIENRHYEEAVNAGIAEAYAEVDAICNNPERPDFENTIVALEKAGKTLERVLGVFGPISSAMLSEEIMDIENRIQPVVSKYSTDLVLNSRLWERIKTVYEDGRVTDPVDRRLLENTYDSFARSGALLEGDAREEFGALREQISVLMTRFAQNVIQEMNSKSIVLDEDEVEGLPGYLIDEAREQAKAAGCDKTYLFTLHQPVYMAVMKYAALRSVRERFYRLYTGRNIEGEFSNIDIVKEIVGKRARLAQLLGYKNASSQILERTMARNPENVMNLLTDLREAYKDAAKKEIESLTHFAQESEGAGFILQPWDYSYWFNKQRNALYDYDEQKLRPYFKLDNVIGGVFGLAEKLYGVTILERHDLPVYQEDVRVFEVRDEDGSHLGILYADFFTRATKQPGAWMTEFKGQCIDDDGNDSRPVVSIVMNFKKSATAEPSLLTPSEVRTFLHEFGHALHLLFSKVKYQSMAGTNVYRDFVELPSQFNENYLAVPEFLEGFAVNYVTRKPLPKDEIEKLRKVEQFGAAYACYRQLSFGFLDMAYHQLKPDYNIGDLNRFEKDAVKGVQLLPEVEGSMISPQFSHIFAGGYASGYYSYKWAEVLDADAFSVFEKEGIFNKETASRFRHEILEKGDSEAPDKLYRNFKGGEPSVDALKHRDGIA